MAVLRRRDQKICQSVKDAVEAIKKAQITAVLAAITWLTSGQLWRRPVAKLSSVELRYDPVRWRHSAAPRFDRSRRRRLAAAWRTAARCPGPTLRHRIKKNPHGFHVSTRSGRQMAFNQKFSRHFSEIFYSILQKQEQLKWYGVCRWKIYNVSRAFVISAECSTRSQWNHECG